jgi:hypothetical protein
MKKIKNIFGALAVAGLLVMLTLPFVVLGEELQNGDAQPTAQKIDTLSASKTAAGPKMAKKTKKPSDCTAYSGHLIAQAPAPSAKNNLLLVNYSQSSVIAPMETP